MNKHIGQIALIEVMYHILKQYHKHSSFNHHVISLTTHNCNKIHNQKVKELHKFKSCFFKKKVLNLVANS